MPSKHDSIQRDQLVPPNLLVRNMEASIEFTL
jgi:hypothetical protein